MDELNRSISINLKRLREQKKLSLDSLAKMTGVSKSMLGQIERGDGNPTITTVWKISNGLKVSFTELTTSPCGEQCVVSAESVPPMIGDGGKYRAHPLFPYDTNGKFEIYYIELDPGATLEAEAHPAGAREFITVFSGSLTVSAEGETLTAHSGEALRFKADVPHIYHSAGDITCRINMVISYE